MMATFGVTAFRDNTTNRSGDRETLVMVLAHLRPQLRLILVALIVMMPLSMMASLGQPYLLKRALDSALTGNERSELWRIGYFLLGVVSAEFIGRFGQTYLLQLVGQRATASLRRQVFGHIQRLRLAYFDRVPTGRTVTRATSDIDSLGEFFTSGAVTAVTDILMLFGIIAIMLTIDAQLTLVALVLLPFVVPVLHLFRKYARAAFREIRLKVSTLNAELSEQLQGLELIKAFDEAKSLQAEYDAQNKAYRAAHYRAIRYDSLLFSVVESISTAAIALIIWFASVRAGFLEDSTQSRLYVGTVVAFYEYIQRFFVPLRDLSQKYAIVQSAIASAERIKDLLQVTELDAEVASTQNHKGQTQNPPAISFAGVGFSYRDRQPVLTDFALDIQTGEHVAFVGKTGSGKTTIASLLLRLYEHDQGSIAVNGVDIRQLSRRDLGKLFSVIPQDVFLFSGTVRNNLGIGAEYDPSDNEMRQALEAVGAWKFVEERGGLEAELGEGGGEWSAGQRQLFAFARALILDRPFLILDEATANVDAETEAHIEKATEHVVSGRTCIIIAHRLTTVRRASRIVVLSGGRIVESGPHEALLEDPSGHYHGLWKSLERVV